MAGSTLNFSELLDLLGDQLLLPTRGQNLNRALVDPVDCVNKLLLYSNKRLNSSLDLVGSPLKTGDQYLASPVHQCETWLDQTGRVLVNQPIG